MIAILAPVTTDESVFSHESAASFVQLMSHFDSTVMLHDTNRVINGKSLLGLLSLGVIASGRIKIYIDGTDEEDTAQAVCDHFPEAIIQAE